MAGKKYEALVPVEWPDYDHLDDEGRPAIVRLNPGESAVVPEHADPEELVKHHSLTPKIGTFAKLREHVDKAVSKAAAKDAAASAAHERDAAEKATAEFLRSL